MINLEEEFQRLMNESINKIEERKTKGEIDKWDALALTKMVQNVLDHGDTSNFGNACPDGHTYRDCGWSPSMGYHCS